MDFDKTIKRLEEICKTLETELPLKESVELYNEGATLVKDCVESLEQTKGSVYKVKEELDRLVETKM